MMRTRSGGRGGDASVYGDQSSAEGGSGGAADGGDGGDGGNATVSADRSHALGGRGGRGGIGRGGRGGDAVILPDGSSLEAHLCGSESGHVQIGPGDTYVTIDGKIALLARGGRNGDEGGHGGDGFAVGANSFVAGGDGGEASQIGDRGDRGGGNIPDELVQHGHTRPTAHMRRPYYEPMSEPGRGGDAPDGPQYKARRLIVEQIKKQYFARQGLPLDQVWWDRDVVPLVWINEQLETNGHHWRTTVVDDEYEFFNIGR